MFSRNSVKKWLGLHRAEYTIAHLEGEVREIIDALIDPQSEDQNVGSEIDRKVDAEDYELCDRCGALCWRHKMDAHAELRKSPYTSTFSKSEGEAIKVYTCINCSKKSKK